MRIIQKSLLVAMLLSVYGCADTGTGAGGTRASQSIEIKEADGGYTLSVSVSRLTMTLPRGNWASVDKNIGGSTSNPRYFYFEDRKEASLILSGWFEPDRLFKGTRENWDRDTQAWKKQGLPEPVNVSFEKLGRWDAVWYDHYLGKAVVSSHLRAHWVQAGTWIDVHLSTTNNKSSAENRKRLKSLLEGISITEKSGG